MLVSSATTWPRGECDASRAGAGDGAGDGGRLPIVGHIHCGAFQIADQWANNGCSRDEAGEGEYGD